MRHATVWALSSACLSRAGPLGQITAMLKTFDQNLKDAAEKDAATYEKFQCACKKDIPDAEGMISDAQQCIADTENTMKVENAAAEKLSKKNAKTKALIEKLITEKNELSSDRAKLIGEWEVDEKELNRVLAALGKALKVMKAKQAKLFLQADRTEIDVELAVVRKFVEKMTPRQQASMTASERHSIVQFLQQPTNAAYATATGGILGILGNMEDNFNRDLKLGTKDYENEMTASQEHETAVDKMLKDNIKLSISLKEKEVSALAKSSQANEKNTKCNDTLDAQTSLQESLKTSCTKNINDYEERSNKRSAEIKAIGKALGIFTSDRIRAVFEKMKATSFVQVSSNKMNAELRKKYDNVAKLLAAKARSSGDIRLRTLSNEVALAAGKDKGVFAPVCKKIYEFKSMLEKEMSEWKSFVEDCNSSKADLNKQLGVLHGEIGVTESKITATEHDIESAENAIDLAKMHISMIKHDVGETTTARNEAHENFLSEHANMSAAVEAMGEALRILKNEYASFIQAPAADFADYQNQDGTGVISLIDGIKADVEGNIHQEVETENDEQYQYSFYVHLANSALASEIADKTDAEKFKADSELKLEELNTVMHDKTSERDDKRDALDKKTKDCRYKSDNLDSKTKAVASEVGVLVECTGILKCVPPRVREEWEDA